MRIMDTFITVVLIYAKICGGSQVDPNTFMCVDGSAPHEITMSILNSRCIRSDRDVYADPYTFCKPTELLEIKRDGEIVLSIPNDVLSSAEVDALRRSVAPPILGGKQ